MGGGMDPYVRCVRDVEILNLPSRKRQEMLNTCNGLNYGYRQPPNRPVTPHATPETPKPFAGGQPMVVPQSGGSPAIAPGSNAAKKPCVPQPDGSCR